MPLAFEPRTIATRFFFPFLTLLLLSSQVVTSLSSAVADESIEASPSVAELSKKAGLLAASASWHALLHSQAHPVHTQTRSLVDTRNFFLTPEGNIDPLAEIQAAVEELFFTSKERRRDFICRFPARAEFLLQELTDSSLNVDECPALREWLQRFPNPQLTLIFAGSYVRNPASLFGHTFLRIDSSRQGNPLLAQTISYSATAEEAPGIAFALKGLAGSYRARYRLSPYAQHRREYNDIEDRELWEYPLDYSEDEVETVLLHLWELKDAEFDYFFIDENCSYNLLSLLEVARPRLRLSTRLRYYTVPLDLVRLLLTEVGLRGPPVFREAPSASLRQRSQALSSEVQTLVDEVLHAKHGFATARLERHDEEQQAQVLDLLLDYLEYKKRYKTQVSEHEEKLYLLRSKLRVPYRHQGSALAELALPHPSGRLGLFVGVGRAETYMGFEFRFLYHDSSDTAYGFPPGSELEFLRLALRSEESSRGVAIEELTLLHLRAAPLFEPLLQTPSWEIAVGGKRREFADADTSFVFETRAGIGATHAFASGVRASLLGGALLQGSRRFTGSVAVSADAVLDVHLPLGSFPTLELRVRGSQVLSGREGSMHLLSLAQPLLLLGSVNVLAEIGQRKDYSRPYRFVQIGVRSYF